MISEQLEQHGVAFTQQYICEALAVVMAAVESRTIKRERAAAALLADERAREVEINECSSTLLDDFLALDAVQRCEDFDLAYPGQEGAFKDIRRNPSRCVFHQCVCWCYVMLLD